MKWSCGDKNQGAEEANTSFDYENVVLPCLGEKMPLKNEAPTGNRKAHRLESARFERCSIPPWKTGSQYIKAYSLLSSQAVENGNPEVGKSLLKNSDPEWATSIVRVADQTRPFATVNTRSLRMR
jgi:hypothetical protein